jgi:riboflavin kinase
MFIGPQEVHVLHKFPTDFYGHHLNVVILGYIRPELDYTSRGQTSPLGLLLSADRGSSESLIEDIHTDIRVALKSLDRPGYQVFASDLIRNPSHL